MSRTHHHGQQRTYGILVGKVKDGHMDPTAATPHYEIWVDAHGSYRIAVNAESTTGSDVLAFFDPNFTSPTHLNLPQRAAGPVGFTHLTTGRNAQGTDYLRDDLFRLDNMADIPPRGAGITLANLLDAQVERAKADSEAVILACGESFQNPGKDPIFGFSPARGLHDVHMMQGDTGHFAADNRVHGDGALFFRYAGGETVALFVRFKTQSTQTDDQTGDPLQHAVATP